MRALLDTNVIVDILQQRQPWCEAGSKIFLAIANQQLTGCITAKEAADIHFFSRKQFKGQDNVDEKARQVISKLFSLFEVIDTMAADCHDAIGIPNNDYEDAIMIASAQRSNIDCIVTRNTEHFKSAAVKIYTPDQFLDVIQQLNEE